MHFEMIDFIFLGILAIFAIIAAIKGFVKAIFGKLCWIIGLLGAFFLYGTFSPILEKYISNQTLAAIASFAVVFLVVFLIIKIVEVIISKIFSGEILRGLDKALGLLFGLLEGFVIVFLLVFALTQQPWIDVSNLTANSFFCDKLAPYVVHTHSIIKDIA